MRNFHSIDNSFLQPDLHLPLEVLPKEQGTEGDLNRLLSLLSGIKPYLESVEGRLKQLSAETSGLLAETSEILINSGGKRLRPALLFFSAQAAGYEGEDLTSLGAALESLHLATLAHDDVIDDSPLRRGRQSIYARYGSSVAVLVGDFFYSQSLALSSSYGGDIIKEISELIADLVSGELAQQASLFDTRQRIEDYFFRTELKTASFIARCCKLGGMIASSREYIPALAAYGKAMGMAFQIHDDILDLTGDPVRMGKPVGEDLSRGVYTLPVLYCLEKSGLNSKLAKLLPDREKPCCIDDIIQLIIDGGGIAYAEETARRLIDQARKFLQVLPCLEGRNGLEELSEFVISRGF